MRKAIRFRVKGHVQGVGFRYSTRRKAAELGLSGWVRNCTNGDVEGVAVGGANHVQALIDWLREGPEYSKVTAVDTRDSVIRDVGGFHIVR